MPNEIIPADAPDRCQRITPTGQCPHQAIPGTLYCDSHQSKQAAITAAKRQYALDNVRVKARLDQFAESQAIYSLKEEIASLRLINEKFLAQIDGNYESYLLAAPNIVKMVEAIEKLVKTSGAMEIKFGTMLSKDTVFSLVRRMIEVFSEEMANAQIANYEDIVASATQRIAADVARSRDTEN